jgi:hypothetical protein
MRGQAARSPLPERPGAEASTANDDARRPISSIDRFARSLQIVLLAAGLLMISWEKPWSYVGAACFVAFVLVGVFHGDFD